MSNVYKLEPHGINGETLQPTDYVPLEGVTSGTPNERGQLALISEDERFTIGIWECTPYSEEIEAYPGDEYSRVLEGSIEITTDGITHAYGAGDSFVIKKGTKVTYAVTSDFRKYFAMYC